MTMPRHKMADIAEVLAQYGRDGDTRLAHITPEEMQHLKDRGGSGSVNPVTGLPEFFPDYGKNVNKNKAISAATGYTGDFGEGQFGEWLSNQNEDTKSKVGTAESTYLDDDGSFKDNLTGGNVAEADLSVQNLIDRKKVRDGGFAGQFGGGAAAAFSADFSDRDNDASTPWTAGTESNTDRFGNDAMADRAAIRDLGFTGEWGGGAADQFGREQAAKRGINASNFPDLIGEINRFDNAAAKTTEIENLQSQQSELEKQLVQLIHQLKNPTPPPRPVGDDQIGTDIGASVPSQAPRYEDPYALRLPAARKIRRLNPYTGVVEEVEDVRDRYQPRIDNSFRGFGNVIRL